MERLRATQNTSIKTRGYILLPQKCLGNDVTLDRAILFKAMLYSKSPYFVKLSSSLYFIDGIGIH